MLIAIVRSENEPSTVCSEVAPNLIHSSPKPVSMPLVIMSLSTIAGRLVAHAVEQLAAGADVLDRGQVAAFVVDAGQAVAHELLGDVGDAVAVALCPLLGREGRPLADAVERVAGAIGDAAVQLAVGVLVEGAARRIRRVLGDAGQLEGLAVVEGGVAAAMMHRDRMLGRDLVQILGRERALVLELGVVVEVALDPGAGRQRRGLRLELVDDALDGDEFDLKRIADQHFV